MASMVACHRWRPAVLVRPADAGETFGPPLDASEHPVAIVTEEGLAGMADSAVASFVRLGRQPDESVIQDVVEIITEFCEAYRLFPCPCQLCPCCGKQPQTQPGELIFAVEYEHVRAAYLREMSLAGIFVPQYIRARGAMLRRLLRAKDDPPVAHNLLRLVVAELYPSLETDLREQSAAIQSYVDRITGPAGTEVVMGWHLTKKRRVEESELVHGPEPSADRIEQAAMEITHRLASSPDSKAVQADRVIAASSVTRSCDPPLSPNDFRWALRRLTDAGLGSLTDDPGLPNWEKQDLYFRSTPALWERWRRGRIFDPPASPTPEPRPKRGGGRPANSDPVWFATAVSLRASFTKKNGTDWKGLASAVRKQLGDGGIKLTSRDEKSLTPGSLKTLFRNRDRRKAKPN